MFKELWSEEGARGLFKGVSARVFYMSFNSLLMITTYEVHVLLCVCVDAHLWLCAHACVRDFPSLNLTLSQTTPPPLPSRICPFIRLLSASASETML